MSARLGIVAAVLVAIWFVWIAIDVRRDDVSDEPLREARREAPGRDGRPPARDGRGAIPPRRERPSEERRKIERPVDRFSRGDGQMERHGDLPPRRQRPAAPEQAEHQQAEVVAGDPNPMQQMREAAERAMADREKDAGSGQTGDRNSGGGTGGSDAPRDFVPGPSQLQPDSDLTGANLREAKLDGLNLAGADLTDAKMHRATMEDTQLSDAILANADLTGASMKSARLGHADMHEARLDGADLRGAEMTGVNLTDATGTKANFAGVSFYGGDLTGANFQGAMLFGTDLRDTVLDEVDFKDADLRDANFTNADITGAQNLTCDQLITARGWETSIRNDDLACGAPIPGLD